MEVFAASDYTLEDLSYINCDIIKDEAHRTYVNAMIKFHLTDEMNTKVRDTLESGKCVMFFFDGASDKTVSGAYTNYKRYHFSAVCVVVKLVDGLPKIVYTDDFTSTIPDNPRDPSLNDGTPVPTVVDGILPVVTTNHGSYAALHLQCHNNSDVIRCTSATSYMSSSTGINIHARSWNYVDSYTYSSTGCFNIGKRVEDGGRFNEFMEAVTGIKNAYYNRFSTTGKDVGVAVIDHTLYAEQIKDIYKGDKSHTAEEIVDIITAYTRDLGVNTELFGAEGHTHTFSEPMIEEAHPHRSYRKCECGYAEVLDDGNNVKSCDICNPLEEDKNYKNILPFVCHIGNGSEINTFSDAYMTTKGIRLDPNGEYTVDRVYNTGACRIVYISGGKAIVVFVPLEDIVCGAKNGLKKENSKKQITTYTFPGGEEYGYVGKGDDIFVAGSENGMTQVLYPISGGKYKLGWIKTLQLYSKEYKIVFDANGGKNTPGTLTKESGVNVKLPSVTPTRDGYTFVCWNTSPDGSGTEYGPYSVYSADKDVKLYAIWKEIPPEVSEEISEEKSEESSEESSEEVSEEPSEEPSEESSEESSEEVSEKQSEEPSEEPSEESKEESLPEESSTEESSTEESSTEESEAGNESSVLQEESVIPEDSSTNDGEENGTSLLVWLVPVIVIAAGIACGIVIKKRKK